MQIECLRVKGKSGATPSSCLCAPPAASRDVEVRNYAAKVGAALMRLVGLDESSLRSV
jgi:hypothetical protein